MENNDTYSLEVPTDIVEPIIDLTGDITDPTPTIVTHAIMPAHEEEYSHGTAVDEPTIEPITGAVMPDRILDDPTIEPITGAVMPTDAILTDTIDPELQKIKEELIPTDYDPNVTVDPETATITAAVMPTWIDGIYEKNGVMPTGVFENRDKVAVIDANDTTIGEVNLSSGETSTAAQASKMKIVNKSTETIVLDLENYDTHVSKIKKDLTNINDSLKDLKKIYKTLADNPKTKGKFKTSINKVVTGVSKKVNNNNTVKNSLEGSIVKSTIEYYRSLTSEKMTLDVPSDPNITNS